MESLKQNLKQYPSCDPFSTHIPSMEVFPTEASVSAAAALDPEGPVLSILNPFHTHVFGRGTSKLTPLDDSEQPQPLPEISFEDGNMTFIRKIYPSGRSAAYLVEFESTRYFLKVVSVHSIEMGVI